MRELIEAEKQVKLVEKNPYNIKRIKNPTDEAILRAIDLRGLEVFTSFTKPMLKDSDLSEDWQNLAVLMRPHDITFLYDPSEKIQISACSKDFNALDGICNATVSAKLAAIKALNDSEELVEIHSRALDNLLSGEISDKLQDAIILSDLMRDGKSIKKIVKTKRFFNSFSSKNQILLRNRYADFYETTDED